MDWNNQGIIIEKSGLNGIFVGNCALHIDGIEHFGSFGHDFGINGQN